MRPLILTPLALVLPLAAAPLSAAEIVLPTTADAVTVFPDRALVTRGGTVTVPAGSHAIIIEGLPSTLLPPSLRVTGKGTGGLVIGSVESKVVPAQALVHEEERRLQAALSDLRDKRRLIDAHKQALQLRQTFIESVAESAAKGLAGSDKGELNPAQWEQAWTRLQAGSEQTLKDMISQDIALRDLDAQIRKVEAELRAVRTGARDQARLRIQVESARDGAADLSVQYQVPGASWAPVYDARLNTEAGTLALSQYGMVRQRTGEDWSDVALTLSTAQPSRGTQMAELSPWWIEPRPPVRTRAMPSAGASPEMAPPMPAPAAKAMRSEREEADVPDAEPIEMRAAEVVSSDFAAEYRIPGRNSVPADSAEHRFAIASQDMAARLSARTVPKREPKAYLFAEVTVAGAAPTLPGPVSLFRDGTYIGGSRLDMMRPGDTAELSFGVDDQVTVAYLAQRGQSGEQGFLAKERRVERRFKIQLANLHSRPMTVMVYDQTPVSRAEEIKVSLLEKDTTPGFVTDIKDRPGVLAWTWEAKPGEKKTIDFGYQVTFPPDRPPVGF